MKHTRQSVMRISRNADNEDEITFMALLSACAKKKELRRGAILHANILRKGLLENSCNIGSALIRMYSKCGAFHKAQEVHDALLARNVMSWNALLVCYSHEGKYNECMQFFERMRNESLCPDGIAFIFFLKACSAVCAIKKAKQIHCEVACRGILKKDIMLGTALVDVYAKCGSLRKAQKIHDGLCARDLVSWSALIAGYARHLQGHSALDCFERMQSEGVSPDAVTSCCILKACATIRAVNRGKHSHHQIVLRGFQKNNVVLGNALIDFYAKCGALLEAQHVMEQLPIRNVECWSTLVAGYVQAEQEREALRCFEMMRNEGLSPDFIAFACALRACGRIGAIDTGKCIHNEVLTEASLSEGVMLGNALVGMYAKCGVLSKAKAVLEMLPHRDNFSWSLLIAEYARHKHVHEAFCCFQQMQSEGIDPDDATFACLLNVCGGYGMIDKGRQLHDEMIKRRFLPNNIILWNALVDMYAKCGELAKARAVLEELPFTNVITWSALIGGYIRHELYHEALHCFECMRSSNVSPNAITFTHILKACGITRDINQGIQIHDEIAGSGSLESDIVLGSALVEMYVNCGHLARAEEVHDCFYVRNVVSWNVLIAGYVRQGQQHKVFCCLERMQGECISADVVTFTSLLKACGSIGAVDKGAEIHRVVAGRGLLLAERSNMLGTALVDLYTKCGMPSKAQEVHDELPIKDTGSWNALIGGYARQGKGSDALCCLETMLRGEGILPDEITLSCLLNACCRSGLLTDNGESWYENLSGTYDIDARSEHRHCVVAMLGYRGLFEDAISMVNTVPSTDHRQLWMPLLKACKNWGNVKLGRLAFRESLCS